MQHKNQERVRAVILANWAFAVTLAVVFVYGKARVVSGVAFL